MNKINHLKEIVLDDCECFDYDDIIYDGCNYYLFIRDCCEIIKYNQSFEKIRSFKIYRKYISICYDLKEECFWAISHEYNCKLYKLDENFKEIRYKNLILYEEFGDRIVGISYVCHNNTLIISSEKCIGELYKKDNRIEIIKCFESSEITSITSISPGYVISVISEKMRYILIYNECLELVDRYKLPDHNYIKSIAFGLCKNHTSEVILYILVKERDCSDVKYKIIILKCRLDYCLSECNYKLYCDSCCNSSCDSCCNSSCDSCCNSSCDSCCNSSCDSCCKHDKCVEIIKSISLVEAAISHILNAEGEKIQKVIAETNDINKILCVNNEVNKTIINITHLEQVIYQQLALLKECNFNICDKDHCCRNVCCQDDHNLCDH